MVFVARKLHLLAAIFALALFQASSSYAQLPTPTPGTFTGVYQAEKNESFVDSPEDVGHILDGDSIRNKDFYNPLHAAFMPSKTCSSVAECATDYLLGHKPGSKQVPINAFLPPVSRSIANRLNDAKMTTLTTDNINSPAYLEKLTVRLAEPSVGGAIDSANLEATNYVEAGYLADMHTIKVGEKFPAAQPFIEAYFHCIQQLMSQTPPLSYPMAQAACRRDGTEAQISNLTAQPNTLPIFAYHPSLDVATAITNYAGGGGPIPGTALTLVDMIFNEEAKITTNQTINVPNYTPLTVAIVNPLDYTTGYAKDFRKYFGDIEYKTTNAAANLPPPANQLTGLKAEYRIVDPQIDLSYEYALLTHVAFDYMRHVMYHYCDWLNSNSGSDEAAFSNFFSYATTTLQPYLAPTVNIANLLANPPTIPLSFTTPSIFILGEQGLNMLSLPQFPFPPILFTVFAHQMDQFYRIPSNPLDPNGGTMLLCTELQNSIFQVFGGGGFKQLLPGVTPTPLQDYISNLKILHNGTNPLNGNGTVPELYKMMNFYARRIALGNILSRAQIARDVVNKLSSSLGATIPEAIINDAYKLITRATGVEVYDLENAIDQNVQDLVDYSMGAFMKMQEDLMRAKAGVGS